MYRSFNIKNTPDKMNDYYTVGNELYKKFKSEIDIKLKNYISQDGVIDGERIQEEWFSEINADIFISHSHTDKILAISLAGWLYQNFGLISFIDSCIWGYSDELLKIIDNEYCRKSNGNFDYKARNHSTSHVHMMLMAALNKMIDKTECLFFLNTANSNSFDGITNKTLSPWIYGEIETSKIIRKRVPKRLIKRQRMFSDGQTVEDLSESKQLSIEHTLNLDHFYSIDKMLLVEWKNISTKKGVMELNNLYNLTRIENK